MILGRKHLILLFDTESHNSSKQIWSVLVGTNYLSFHKFLNFVFKRLKHFVNHFWFWWYVIQQHSPKSLIFCITIVKNLFFVLHVFAVKFLIFCLFFNAIFDSLQGVGCKTGVGSFGIGLSKMLIFFYKFCRFQSMYQLCLSELIITSYTSLFCDGFQLHYCMILHFYSRIFFLMTFHKIKFIFFVLKKQFH